MVACNESEYVVCVCVFMSLSIQSTQLFGYFEILLHVWLYQLIRHLLREAIGAFSFQEISSDRYRQRDIMV